MHRAACLGRPLSTAQQSRLMRREIVVELPGRRLLEVGLQEALDELDSGSAAVDELLTVRLGADDGSGDSAFCRLLRAQGDSARRLILLTPHSAVTSGPLSQTSSSSSRTAPTNSLPSSTHSRPHWPELPSASSTPCRASDPALARVCRRRRRRRRSSRRRRRRRRPTRASCPMRQSSISASRSSSRTLPTGTLGRTSPSTGPSSRRSVRSSAARSPTGSDRSTTSRSRPRSSTTLPWPSCPSLRWRADEAGPSAPTTSRRLSTRRSGRSVPRAQPAARLAWASRPGPSSTSWSLSQRPRAGRLRWRSRAPVRSVRWQQEVIRPPSRPLRSPTP
jgi:hypothetical protein